MACTTGAIALTRVVAQRAPRPVARGAVGLLAIDVAGNAAGLHEIVRQALCVARERNEQQVALAVARRGRALGHAHQPLASIQPELRTLLRSDLGDGRWRVHAEAATMLLERIADALIESRPLRDALADDRGRLPFIGGHAGRLPHRAADPLPRFGTVSRIPAGLPLRVRRVGLQVALVLDEVRLLHNAEIERSVLLFTLVARASLLALAPVLGSWTSAPAPLRETSAAGDLAWAAMLVVALSTAARGATVVELAMEDSRAGRRLRTRLLRIEVPLSVVGVVFCPAWTVVVFASGWTNWWQRQTPGLAFHWGKLATFVVAIVGLQQFGLARSGVAVGDAVAESVLTLVAILVVGASYGAMLPLAAATVAGVVFGDTRRSLDAARQARGELLRCAHQLDATADALREIGSETPVAATVAATARQAARHLERSADRLGRGGLMASHVLEELADEAAARSFLPRIDSPALARATAAAAAAEPPPAHVGGPLFTPRSLRYARIAKQHDARRMRAVVESALNEARRHGTGSVRVLFSIDAGRVILRIGNRPRRPLAPPGGLAGEGTGQLARLVAGLPDGRVEWHGPAAPRSVGLVGTDPWWMVSVSCAALILDEPVILDGH